MRRGWNVAKHVPARVLGSQLCLPAFPGVDQPGPPVPKHFSGYADVCRCMAELKGVFLVRSVPVWLL